VSLFVRVFFFFVAGCTVVLPAFPLALEGPDIAKLSWSTRSPRISDIDSDGRNDLVMIDNAMYAVDILYQEKDQRDSGAVDENGAFKLLAHRFRKVEIPLNQRLYDLVTGDFNRDGRIDIAVTGSIDGLVVLYQGRNGSFEKKETFELEQPAVWEECLYGGDLDGNGSDDLLIMTKVRLVEFLQGEDGKLHRNVVGPLPSDGCYNLSLEDFDGDGISDVLYLDSRSKRALRFRPGRTGAVFGPEIALDVDEPRGSLEALGASGLLMLPKYGRNVELLNLVSRKRMSDDVSDLQPSIHPVPLSGKKQLRYTSADLDGDGVEELVVADPGEARLLVYSWSADTFDPPRSFPSLQGIISLDSADLDGDGREEILMASGKERTVAVSRLTSEGRLDFPRSLPVKAKPVAVAGFDADGDGRKDVVVSVEDHHKGALVVFPGGEGRDPLEIPLEDIDAVIESMRSFDLDGNGRDDLMLFAPREPLVILLSGEQGIREPEGIIRGNAGLLSRSDADSITFLIRDGHPGFLVPSKAFARVFEIVDDRLEAVEQFNSDNNQAVLGGAMPVDLDGDGVRELLLAHDGDGKLEILKKDTRGVYRSQSTLAIPEMDVIGLDFLGNGSGHILVFGAGKFLEIPLDGWIREVRHRQIFVSNLEDVEPDTVISGDLDGDHELEIVLIDSRNTYVLQVLKKDSEGDWKSVLHFPIFDDDPYRDPDEGGTRQPHDVLSGDITGDGLDDLILLIHNKLLLYSQ